MGLILDDLTENGRYKVRPMMDMVFMIGVGPKNESNVKIDLGEDLVHNLKKMTITRKYMKEENCILIDE